jgi:hypothetical protein
LNLLNLRLFERSLYLFAVAESKLAVASMGRIEVQHGGHEQQRSVRTLISVIFSN